MEVQEVVIYTTMYCPYCERAKALLGAKNVAFREVAVDGDRALRQAMTELAGGRTSVPQIFFGTRHVGGCDDASRACELTLPCPGQTYRQPWRY